ncbi:GNAT family N-acetyltransferase [Nocardioides donggukensis]|uniref:GNAT family N-acetyltransferase n=1 Tax=Nocardioides donggukensis TaxID=2774019 RepID=A0A927K5E9_9ACTN|nr:GNAT family N-acetyltransferase [Nocardioides donggukensis]MBD8870138.1 GNAT family N-acetyltransferase [Nocardioides donggukensis]
MLLRRAVPADLERIGEITVAAYAPFLGGPEDSYADRLRDAASRHREAELWVAEEEGVVLGSVTVCPPGSPWRELARAEEGEFRMLSVAPTAHGRGVGAALVRLALDRAREQQARRVVISSLPVMSAAHRLYERLGFTRAPERDWSPLPGVGLIAYTLPLDPS